MSKILVLDDSLLMREYLKLNLEEHGYQVELFEPESALQVFEKIRELNPDLVITDYRMPLVDGLNVVRMAQRVSRSLPVLVLTSTRDPVHLERLLRAGAARILHKPIRGSALRDAIEELLEAS
jgi:two-component system response regulator YesN